MRLGVVSFCCSYVVDLDDPDMVEAAQDAIYDEVVAVVEDSTLDQLITVTDDPDADPAHIPDFLTEPDCA